MAALYAYEYGIAAFVAIGSLLEATSRCRSLLSQQTYELARWRHACRQGMQVAGSSDPAIHTSAICDAGMVFSGGVGGKLSTFKKMFGSGELDRLLLLACILWRLQKEGT